MELELQLQLIPHQSGVYRFLNNDGTIIYVGKAKDLKKRVSQYFQSTRAHSAKTRKMVSQIASIQTTVVESESDALLLENNLIKTIQPKYNILLKDDKTYPWICVKREPFPRVMATHKKVQDGSLYFGPYTNGSLCKQLLTLIHTLYPLRTCSLPLHARAIALGKYKKCLQAHIGRCKAPCQGGQTELQYNRYIECVKSILKGDTATVRRLLEEQMKQAAQDQQFEQAQQFKEQWEALTRYQSKSVIVSNQVSDVDVFSLEVESDGNYAFGNFMRMAAGAVIQSQNVKYRLRLEEAPETLLGLFLAEMQQQTGMLSKEVLVPFLPDALPQGCYVHVPQKGDKLTLLQLSLRNTRTFRLEQLRQAQALNPELRREKHTQLVLQQMKTDLGMKQLPLHMECFDNSNLQGTNPVASCVVFRNAVPSKKDYRHFGIKTVEGPNDFASMTEVVHRRYARMIEEGQSLPQLIVIDGGKGQLSAAYMALVELGIEEQVFIIGLAKRLEEIYKVGDPLPLYLDKNSASLRVIMRIRDEAHRFGITFHRKKRSATFAQSSLLDIKGIGPATVDKLLAHFKSTAQVKKASETEIAAVVGPAAAKKICQGTGS